MSGKPALVRNLSGAEDGMDAETAARALKLERLTGSVGAEAFGIDLNEIDDRTVSAIKMALAEYGMVYFRDQTLTPAQHVALGSRFGELDVNPMISSVPGYPPIYPFRRAPEDKGFLVGEGWHTDVSFYETPAAYSMLYCRETPDVGGDTCYSSQVRAYEVLSPGLKKTLAPMRAIHTVSLTYNAALNSGDKDKLKAEEERAVPDPVSHPVLRIHPVNGRVALYVNSLYTSHFDGWTVAESKPLLDYLTAHAGNPAFGCRLRWKPGTLAMWDNRVVQHSATGDYSGHRREMDRVTVLGERPFGLADESE